jgi:hypothetical protein
LKQPWIGLALLSASWLFGLSYYHDAQWLAWAIFVAAGTGLFIGVDIRRPTALESAAPVVLLRKSEAAGAVMLLPAICLAPWLYRVAPLLIFVGLVLGAVPIPRRWPKVFASALILVGIILLAQSLAILGYECITAKSHELVWPWPGLLYVISRLLGFQTALDGTNLALYSPRVVHLLGATWELLLDPATLSFLVGGIVMLCLCTPITQPQGKQKWRLVNRLVALVTLTAAWLFVRAAILISIFMHRALRTGYDEELALMEQFWNPWLLSVFLLGPILLSLRFLHTPFGGQPPRLSAKADMGASEPGVRLNKRIGAIVLLFTGSFILIMGLLLDTPGRRKQGRVMVDEFHSTWEPTDKPFDTNWYGHDSGYNYYCIYDYCSRFYDMSRLNTSLDDAAVRNCDVLVVKVPTLRYNPEEIKAIERFVERGGGLLLMGEHTNVFNTGTHLNDVAKIFGFSFRYDCLFDIDTIYTQLYNLPLVPHPIIQSMPPFNFAVSCSINPGRSLGRAVIRSTGLKNLLADYHAGNFYPQVEDKAEMRYGAFVQLLTTHHGAGRVVAFTDSTVFSNFATFEPGKAELMLGMLEWLNHRNFPYPLRILLILLGILLTTGGLALCRRPNVAWLVVVSAGVFGWSIAAVSTRAIHRYSMPLPKAVRPMVEVVVDRTVCDAPLSQSGFIAGKIEGFGIFERWILRLGYFTSRKSGINTMSGDVLVFTHPHLTVKSDFREELVNYVASGGKVLILDSPENTESTANSLLYPFGLNVNQSTRINGQLKAPEGWPIIKIDSAFQIEGGEPIMWVENTPVAAKVRHGKGTVTVIGFGSRFADAYMGVTGDVVPDDELRKVFDLQFTILKNIVSGP